MRRHCAGFTLIELLVTLALIGLLATITVPLAQLNLQRKNEQELRLALREIRTAIDLYKRASDEGRIPRSIGASGFPTSLELLVEGVVDQRDPNGRKIFFLRRIPRDPLFANSATNDSETWGKRSYASEADDPKEGDDVFDVYSKNTGLALNGISYKRW